MPLFSFEGHEPVVSPGAWIAPTATLVGDVRVAAEASVWYGAVIRAETACWRGGVPARVVGKLTPGARSWVETNPGVYRELAARHAASVRPVGF